MRIISADNYINIYLLMFTPKYIYIYIYTIWSICLYPKLKRVNTIECNEIRNFRHTKSLIFNIIFR